MRRRLITRWVPVAIVISRFCRKAATWSKYKLSSKTFSATQFRFHCRESMHPENMNQKKTWRRVIHFSYWMNVEEDLVMQSRSDEITSLSFVITCGITITGLCLFPISTSTLWCLLLACLNRQKTSWSHVRFLDTVGRRLLTLGIFEWDDPDNIFVCQANLWSWIKRLKL